MTLRCVIIDDEPIARKGLKEYIQDASFLQLAGEFDNPLKAADLLMLLEGVDLGSLRRRPRYVRQPA